MCGQYAKHKEECWLHIGLTVDRACAKYVDFFLRERDVEFSINPWVSVLKDIMFPFSSV